MARARAELRAAGDTAGEPSGTSALTPQQAQTAGLVAEGATNREIAARLFLSHRTVEHHLRNIFARLGVRSRVELTRRLDQTSRNVECATSTGTGSGFRPGGRPTTSTGT